MTDRHIFDTMNLKFVSVKEDPPLSIAIYWLLLPVQFFDIYDWIQSNYVIHIVWAMLCTVKSWRGTKESWLRCLHTNGCYIWL